MNVSYLLTESNATYNFDIGITTCYIELIPEEAAYEEVLAAEDPLNEFFISESKDFESPYNAELMRTIYSHMSTRWENSRNVDQIPQEIFHDFQKTYKQFDDPYNFISENALVYVFSILVRSTKKLYEDYEKLKSEGLTQIPEDLINKFLISYPKMKHNTLCNYITNAYYVAESKVLKKEEVIYLIETQSRNFKYQNLQDRVFFKDIEYAFLHIYFYFQIFPNNNDNEHNFSLIFRELKRGTLTKSEDYCFSPFMEVFLKNYRNFLQHLIIDQDELDSAMSIIRSQFVELFLEVEEEPNFTILKEEIFLGLNNIIYSCDFFNDCAIFTEAKKYLGEYEQHLKANNARYEHLGAILWLKDKLKAFQKSLKEETYTELVRQVYKMAWFSFKEKLESRYDLALEWYFYEVYSKETYPTKETKIKEIEHRFLSHFSACFLNPSLLERLFFENSDPKYRTAKFISSPLKVVRPKKLYKLTPNQAASSL